LVAEREELLFVVHRGRRARGPHRREVRRHAGEELLFLARDVGGVGRRLRGVGIDRRAARGVLDGGATLLALPMVFGRGRHGGTLLARRAARRNGWRASGSQPARDAAAFGPRRCGLRPETCGHDRLRRWWRLLRCARSAGTRCTARSPRAAWRPSTSGG